MEDDLRRVRRMIDWQSVGYDGWMRCYMVPFNNLRSGVFVFFACYTVAGLVPPVSPFLLTLLEFYGLQLQHMLLHSLILVVIFVHFYKMFVCVRPWINLFRLFHVLRWSGKGTGLISAYYF
jgi:hypothetical protein